MELIIQLWKKIAIAINWKYLRKKFWWNREDKKKMNEDEMEDMQVGYGLHVTRIIYMCGIQK